MYTLVKKGTDPALADLNDVITDAQYAILPTHLKVKYVHERVLEKPARKSPAKRKIPKPQPKKD